MKSRWTQKVYEGSYGIRGETVIRPLAFGSDLRWGKVSVAFRLHTASLDKDRLK